MRVNFNSRINFQASFVNSCTVGKYLPLKNEYENKEVYFVKLDPLDKNDIDVLDNIADYWLDDIFSINIYNNANDIYQKNLKDDVPYKEFFYALTTQKDNLEKLDYNNVLGICDGKMFSKRNVYLSHIQVKPEYIYSYQPEYKGLGTAIINSLKNLYSQIELSSRTDKSIRNFYIKNGFINKPDSKTKFIWRA